MPKKSELTEYRARLLALQARIRGDVAQLTDEALESAGSNGDSKSPTHLAELGSQTWEQDFSLRRVEDDQEVLEEITAALKRLDNGTYGTCEMCLEEGKPPAKATIARSRLQLIPYARHCIECERKREQHTA